MDKDFDRWNRQKKNIHKSKRAPFFQEREVWWCSLGINIGFEESGKNHYYERPVLIYRKFNQSSFLAIPISSKPKQGIFYASYSYGGQLITFFPSQIRFIDAKRLRGKMFSLPKDEFTKIDAAFWVLIKRTTPP